MSVNVGHVPEGPPQVCVQKLQLDSYTQPCNYQNHVSSPLQGWQPTFVRPRAPSSSSLDGAVPHVLPGTVPVTSNISNQPPRLSIFTDLTSTTLPANGHSAGGPSSIHTSPLQVATPTPPAAVGFNKTPTAIIASTSPDVNFPPSLSRRDSQPLKRTVDENNLDSRDEDANKRLRLEEDKIHTVNDQQEPAPGQQDQGESEDESDGEVMEVDKDGLVPIEYCVAAIFDQEENEAGERPCKLCK
jgi:hypothetical protein